MLPSYGMTECMPISSPPVGYALERPGTSGLACGPELCIMDGGKTHELARGEIGGWRGRVAGADGGGGYKRHWKGVTRQVAPQDLH